MIDPIAGWRDRAPIEVDYHLRREARARQRERTVLSFITLVVFTVTALTGAITAVLMV
ncbi:MAG: hypothetical protein J0H44_00170 [Alphaproteobacteria bacterium]|nr:hypothetical protein [Alphaproteobacteria bacterium]